MDDADLEKYLGHFRVSMEVPARGLEVPMAKDSTSLWFHIEVLFCCFGFILDLKVRYAYVITLQNNKNGK